MSAKLFVEEKKSCFRPKRKHRNRRAKLAKLCSRQSCNFLEEYYGHRCSRCGVFYPHGGAPWDFNPDDDFEDDYYITCSGCGGEYGNGWSTCICEDENEQPISYFIIDDAYFDDLPF